MAGYDPKTEHFDNPAGSPARSSRESFCRIVASLKHRGATRSWCLSAARVTGFLLVALLAGHREVDAAQLTLTWVDNAIQELGFAIERSTGTSAEFAEIATVGPGVTAYTDLTVADATAYCYRVRAFDETGYSEYSDVACSPALDVTLSLNQTTVSNGDDLIVSAHIHVKAHFANPVDGYLILQDPSGSLYPVTSYVGADVESQSVDFTRVKDLGTVTALSPGIYTLWLVVVRAGGDSQSITDRLGNLASISFTVQ
jgi:hypothetical protein